MKKKPVKTNFSSTEKASSTDGVKTFMVQPTIMEHTSISALGHNIDSVCYSAVPV